MVNGEGGAYPQTEDASTSVNRRVSPFDKWLLLALVVIVATPRVAIGVCGQLAQQGWLDLGGFGRWPVARILPSVTHRVVVWKMPSLALDDHAEIVST